MDKGSLLYDIISLRVSVQVMTFDDLGVVGVLVIDADIRFFNFKNLRKFSKFQKRHAKIVIFFHINKKNLLLNLENFEGDIIYIGGFTNK